jgi:hypothetical protein
MRGENDTTTHPLTFVEDKTELRMMRNTSRVEGLSSFSAMRPIALVMMLNINALSGSSGFDTYVQE